MTEGEVRTVGLGSVFLLVFWMGVLEFLEFIGIYNIKRNDPDIVSVKGKPEPDFAAMLEALKTSGVSIVQA